MHMREKEMNFMFTLLRILGMTIGSTFCAIAINGFLVPHHLLSGGVSGIAILLNASFGVKIGLVVLVVNIPLFLVSYKKLDKDFTVYSFFNMFIFSMMLLLTADISQNVGVDDIILSAVFGGIINGVGMGITFKSKCSQGGTDIVATYVKKKWNTNLGTTLMLSNVVIVSLGSIVFGAEKAMYTLISMYVAYQVVDRIQIMLDKKKSIMIISDKSEEISNQIMAKVGRGVTFLQGEGGYSKTSQKVIYTIISSKELPRIIEIVDSVDECAFMSVNEATEVKGRGFKESYI